MGPIEWYRMGSATVGAACILYIEWTIYRDRARWRKNPWWDNAPHDVLRREHREEE